ncbi:hypothetical protein M413DRAFT_422389 [Hebeloma cylindrosporum]|uniref:SET domain-containing protein n=1 Tax=Hebeloma cylindrosporum TaxID=76867 RepID=A0A0C2Z139_HEBCY|nr:hypothetical protein M413DRAFT_422389 [Hebeloma cylindrosporum h7]
MKRGFLNGSKAKRQLEAKVSNQSPNASRAAGPNIEYPARENAPRPQINEAETLKNNVPAPTAIPINLTKPGMQLAPVPKTAQKNYIIKNTADMGKGIFATRDIKAYELVFAERPILITHNGIPPPIYLGGNKGLQGLCRRRPRGRWTFLAQLRGALDRMKEEDKQAFMDLAQVPSFGEHWGPLGRRIQTNSFGIMGLDPKIYSGIGKVASFMNHSCCPNVIQNFDLPTLSITFAAVRDIKKGEQIVYSYTDIYQPAAARQQDVAKYSFRCKCKACIGYTSDIDKFRATYREALSNLFAYQNRFLRNPLVTEQALNPVYQFKSSSIKAGIETSDADKIILETLEMVNERKGDGKEVLRLGEEKKCLLKLFPEN